MQSWSSEQCIGTRERVPSLSVIVSNVVHHECSLFPSRCETTQVDELSALNTGKSVSAMTALFREFKWSASAGTLVQTAFPGIFPDLTRFQAEADQAQVNQGHQPWKLSATQVANTLAVSLLNWSASSPTTLISGGGAHDVSAVVRVRSSAVGSGAILVTLSRPEGNVNGGIWEGVLVLSAPSNANGSIAAAVMEKVLIKAAEQLL